MTRKPSSLSVAATYSAAEIRRLVQLGKDRGLVRGPGESIAVAKNGEPAAALAGVRTQWMEVTPELARQWLENNFRNRSLDDDVVAAYARDMTNGVWVATHQGVAFNDRDELIDGQHRLHAIVRSGKTIRLMVTFGLPSVIEGHEMTTMDAVDRGRTRSVADQLKIQHGLKDGAILAQLCASLGSTCCGERTRRLSVGQTLDIYRAYEHPLTWVIIHRSRENGLRTAGVLAAFAFALATEEGFFGGATPIAQMYQALMSGEGLKSGLPMARLREFLTSEEAKLLIRSTNRACVELVLEAIWLEQKGKPIAKLDLGTRGVEHFRALQEKRVAKVAAMFALPEKAK
jgi:antitoxin (DNA-binding transcriptional repressor) of toxin-antitoxin stability system